MQQSISVLYTTVGTQIEAEKMARNAIDNKLAVCVNIIPGGQSIYRWNDQIEQASECYMLFKTTHDLLPDLEAWILNHHPYDTPAILKWQAATSCAFEAYINVGRNIT